MKLDEVIRLWQDQGQKAFPESSIQWFPAQELWPHREYTWTRSKSRPGLARVNNKLVDLPGPVKWDALVEDLKVNGWNARDPLWLAIGREGTRVTEGNHRLAIALKLGIKVPVQVQYHTGKVPRKSPMLIPVTTVAPKAVERAIEKRPPRELSPDEEKKVDQLFDLLFKRAFASRIAYQYIKRATTRGYLKFEDEQRVRGHHYKFMGNQEDGYIYLKVPTSKRFPSGWRQAGRLFQSDKGWFYRFRGYAHGYWKKWWEAAAAMHKAEHFAPTKSPTPPGYKRQKPVKDEDVSDMDLDFAMFAHAQEDLELVDTSLEQLQQYQDAWP